MKSNFKLAVMLCGVFLVGCGGTGGGSSPDTGQSGKDDVTTETSYSSASAPPKGEVKDTFTVAVSIYAGWMPHYYGNDTGVYKKWAEKYGKGVEFVYMDYIASIEAYVAGQVDACVMTNMEALDMPAASGVDSTVVIVGDYSNGNDKILTRGIKEIAGLKGAEIPLVELSVSHYLLVRALESAGLQESDVSILNTSDSDIGAAFISNESQKAVVTWNPIAMEIETTPGVVNAYDSSRIPGEVLDLMIVNTKTLQANPELGKLLVGGWYEIMGVMTERGPGSQKAFELMAERAGCSVTEYKAQLATTAMFYTPDEAIAYISGDEAKERMDFVRKFCFSHALLGEDAESVDAVGIEYPDGSVVGDGSNVKLRFTTDYMEMAKDGTL